jgi:hypothetical protein
MSREFKREVRYIVIKLKDIDENTRRQLGNFMEDLEIPSRDCVVVESDWPEYEPVWKMIEDRVTGKAALASREDAPIAAVTGYYGGHCVIEQTDRAVLLPVGMALYSGTQAAVPDMMEMEPFQTVDKSSKNYKAGWNACRAAILANKERTE